MSIFRIFLSEEASNIVISSSIYRTLRGDWRLDFMSALMDADPYLALFREDLVALKRDVANLIEHMKGGATNTVQNAAGHVGRRVLSLRREARAEGARSARAVNHFIEKQPFVALTITAAFGYLGARVLRR
jgi:hypothetical protein